MLESKSYKGEMVDDIYHGYGRYFYLDHRLIYEGGYSKGERKGKGELEYSPNLCEWKHFIGEWDKNTWKKGTL